PPEALVELFVALVAAGRPALVDQLVTAVATTDPGPDLSLLLVDLERADVADIAAQLLNALSAERWAELDIGRTAESLTVNKSLVRQLDARNRWVRRRHRITQVVRYTASVIGLLILAAVIVIGGAALSRILVRPHFNWGDWAAFVPTTVVVAVILGGITGTVVIARMDTHETEGILIAYAMIIALIAGFSCGFFVDDLRDVGVLVRNWLAWNF